MLHTPKKLARYALLAAMWTFGLGLTGTQTAIAFAPSQQPPSTTSVPGNVVLALSVEFPTGLQVSYSNAYSFILKYEGYFDNRKCYSYSTTNEVFSPISALNATTGTCPSATEWSGNLLNWLTMTNVDQFRSAMTGGTRDTFSSIPGGISPGDTTSSTILIRSLSDRNSYNPLKTVTGLPGMPLAGTKIVRSGGYGSKFIVANVASASNMTAAEQRLSCAATPAAYKNPTLAGGECYNIRVQACVNAPASIGLEANCNASYTSVAGQVAKPEGIIQKHAHELRFAAMGYLNESTRLRNGGVLRSAMKSVGPVAATSTGAVTNTAKEWNEVTGVMITNPDPTDATASTVTNSGLMNYLNKFGFAAGYKGFDPVGELYYAAQLYLRGVAPPTDYSDSLTATLKDGFPVITGNPLLAGGTRDPIINSCQKNFILGIGDIFTHCDGNLQGSANVNNSGTCGASIPIDPAGLNVQELWDATRALETPALGDNAWVGGATGGTPYMAGLAHWANTNAIRPSMPDARIRTYWVDVLENTNGAASVAAASVLRSQFWLAAKYGGFDTTMNTSGDPNTVRNSWDANIDGIPDNWFAGSDPVKLKSSLSAAFSQIATAAQVGSSSSAAVTSTRQTSTSQIVYAGYDTGAWTGSVRACSPTQTALQCTTSPTWEASRWFNTTALPALVPTPLVPSTRKIFTSYGGGAALTSMPFTYASLNAAQQAILDAGDGQGAARVAYLRGDRTNESGLFRRRADSLLGDIVNSGVTYVSGAGPAYAGNNEPAYLAFRACNRAGCAGSPAPRRPVVYVGANDGMLHAFSGANGKELFAYIPGAVFGKLPGLTSVGFTHQYFVDSTPMVGDIQQNPTTWKTILVGGLGAGGQGYYALNITDQNAFSTSWSTTSPGLEATATANTETSAQAISKEAALSAALPMWEFTSAQDADMGYTFNEPSLDSLTGAYLQIAKVADSVGTTGVWRVIVGNGFGSGPGSGAGVGGGKAVLFMLDANTGLINNPLTDKLVAQGGPNNGLAAPTPVDTNNDGLIDTIYAGDLLGNMHKFQFSKPDVAGPGFVLAAPGPADGGAWRHLGIVLSVVGEPITTAPSVSRACDRINWNVAFGTGKLNEATDYTDTAPRGFYSVVDKNPSSSLIVAGADIENILFVDTTVSGLAVRNWATPNLTGRSGWKMALTAGERVLSNSTTPPDTGVVLFGTTKPSGNVCAPGNSGFIMAVNTCTGKSGDIRVNGLVVGGFGVDTTGIVKVSNTYTGSGNKRVIVCNQDACKGGGGTNGGPELTPTIAPKGRYSWRELLTK